MKKTTLFVSTVFAAALMFSAFSAMAAETKTMAVKKEMVKAAVLSPEEMKKCEDYAKNPASVKLTKEEIAKCKTLKPAGMK
jgi:predicted transglutaminase-like cysteine proteinase